MYNLNSYDRLLLSRVERKKWCNQFYAGNPNGARYVVMMEDGSYDYHKLLPCYGLLRHYRNKNLPASIMTAYPEKSPDAEFYYNWLINFSPFRHAYKIKDVKFMTNKGNFHDLSLPSNYLLSSMIAGRFPWVRRKNFQTWKRMTELGVCPALAFVAAQVVYEFPQMSYTSGLTVIGVKGASYSDSDSINVAMMSPGDARNFCLGSPVGALLPPYEKSLTYSGVWKTWTKGYNNTVHEVAAKAAEGYLKEHGEITNQGLSVKKTLPVELVDSFYLCVADAVQVAVHGKQRSARLNKLRR